MVPHCRHKDRSGPNFCTKKTRNQEKRKLIDGIKSDKRSKPTTGEKGVDEPKLEESLSSERERKPLFGCTQHNQKRSQSTLSETLQEVSQVGQEYMISAFSITEA